MDIIFGGCDMETLISPWMIYLLSITSALNMVAFVGLIITCFMTWTFLSENTRDLSTKGWIFTGIIAFTSLLILIFVPNKHEMIAIIASSTITPDNFPTDMQEYIDSLLKACGVIK